MPVAPFVTATWELARAIIVASSKMEDVIGNPQVLLRATLILQEGCPQPFPPFCIACFSSAVLPFPVKCASYPGPLLPFLLLSNVKYSRNAQVLLRRDKLL